jgi:adenosylcobinamide-GDP ribazoletransferase
VAPFALGLDLGAHTRTGPALAAAITASALTTVTAARYFQKRIGGYTGDCLGAVQQLTELSFLVAALAVVGSAPRPG